LLLVEAQTGAAADNTQPQIVEIPRSHLACQQPSVRTVGVAHISRHFIIQPPSLNARQQFATQGNRLHTAHKCCQLPRVGADIANGPGTGKQWIAAPAGLFVIGDFQPFAEPALQVFHLDSPDLPQFPCRHSVPGFAHHRQGAVIMGEDKPATAVAHLTRQRIAFLKADAERFVANHMNTLRQKRLRHRHVQMIGRDDGYRINTVIPRRFPLRHLLPAGIASVRRDKQRIAGTGRHLRAGRKRPRHQFKLIVQTGCNAVNRADKCAFTAAHHA